MLSLMNHIKNESRIKNRRFMMIIHLLDCNDLLIETLSSSHVCLFTPTACGYDSH